MKTPEERLAELLAALASLVATLEAEAAFEDRGNSQYAAGIDHCVAKIAALLKDPAATTTDDQARSRPAMESGAGALAAETPTAPTSSRTE